MIHLYVSPSCTSCRKAKAWLEEHQLPFTEKNIYHDPLTKEELKEILMLTENGTEDIISFRSQAYQNLDVDLDTLSFNQLLDLLIEEPSLVRRPIIMDDRRLQIGYNEEEIRMFLPRQVRTATLLNIHKKLAQVDEAESA